MSRDLVYGPDPTHRFDLYRPLSPSPRLPVIVWVPAGGWTSGSRANTNAAIQRFAENGTAAIVSVSHRLAPQHLFPAPVTDVKRVIRHLRANAAHYGIDPTRIVVAGGSAGGNIAATVAATNGLFEPTGLIGAEATVDSSVAAAVNLVGPTDFETFGDGNSFGDALKQAYLGCPSIGCPVDTERRASVEQFVDATDPPIYFGFGELDTLVVAGTQAGPLAARWSTARDGDGVVYDVYTGEGHSPDIWASSAFQHFMRASFGGKDPTVDPRGRLDVVESRSPGSIDLRGWAIDQSAPSVPIQVAVRVDHQPAISIRAADVRPDVAARFPDAGDQHGFTTTIPAGAGEHTVCATAMNTGPGLNTPLGCRVVLVRSSDPFGFIDPATRNPDGSLRLTGLAADPETADPIAVRVSVDGSAPLTVMAGQVRSDAATVPGVIGELHGFDVTVSAAAMASVCVTAVNRGLGSDSPIGCLPPSYTPTTPARLADTRPGLPTVDGVATGGGPIGQGAPLNVRVAGRAGIPTTGAAAVALNVTGTGASHESFLTVYAHGVARPKASNLNVEPNRTVANLVVAPVGADGSVDVFNAVGSTHIVVDVVGWYAIGSQLQTVDARRLLDTRGGAPTFDGRDAGTGAVGQGEVRRLRIAGRAGLPPTGVATVLLNVTATESSDNSYLTVFPSGAPQPFASNLNPAAGRTVPALVAAKVGADGQVDLLNGIGRTHLVVDVVGWLPADAAELTTNPPARLTDTRPGASTDDGLQSAAGAIGSGQAYRVRVAGRGTVPTTAKVVAVTVTGTDATALTHLTVHPSGSPLPGASTLNLGPGDVRANLVFARLGVDGSIDIHNFTGATHLVVDVVGWA